MIVLVLGSLPLAIPTAIATDRFSCEEETNMSNYVPLTPIGGPAGQPFPRQQSFPPPPRKKSNVMVWVLAVCGTFIVIGVIAAFLGRYYVRKAAEEAGLDPELMQKSPALAVAKMMVAANPDVFELVSVDDEKRLITIRNKKTGKTDTLNMDAQDLSWIVAKPGDGEPYIGRDKIADLAFMLPDWFPSYPGTTVQGTFYTRGKKGRSGSFGFSTPDSIDKVVKFYEDNLKQAGLKVTTKTVPQSGVVSMGSLAGEDAGKNRTAIINAFSEKGQTRVTVVFASKEMD